jgi:BASS family bile acid:Na+ symporter
VNAALPAALAFIMFSLGLALRLQDFRAVLQHPRALALGLAAQLLLLPLAGAAVAWAAALPPLLAVGLMLLAACPGGASAGLLTRLGGGDVALSVVLSALTSLLAMLTLPLVLDLSLQAFADSRLQVELPLGTTVQRMFWLSTLPVVAGMALRAAAPRLTQGLQLGAGALATALFLLMVVLTFWQQRALLVQHAAHLGLACLALDALVLAAAWALARGARLPRPAVIAIATECGLQNAALGIYVAHELLQQPALAVPSVVYALWMNVGALLLVAALRWRGVRPCAPSQPA